MTLSASTAFAVSASKAEIHVSESFQLVLNKILVLRTGLPSATLHYFNQKVSLFQGQPGGGPASQAASQVAQPARRPSQGEKIRKRNYSDGTSGTLNEPPPLAVLRPPGRTYA